jgi:hypothetical protein
MIDDILKELSPHAILVGSAARGDEFVDIELVVSEKGLEIAKKILPNWDSTHIGHVATHDTVVPIECMYWWYGPHYANLCRRKLARKSVLGIEFRSWPEEPSKRKK